MASLWLSRLFRQLFIFLWCGGFDDGGFNGDLECWTVD